MKAIIFDCDGTLVDTMPTHYVSWQETLAPYGLELSEERFYALGGWTSKAILELLANEAGIAIDTDEGARRKDATYAHHLPFVQPIPEVLEIARAAKGNIPIAVATGSSQSLCAAALQTVGISDWFDAVVCAEDVAHCKPAPDTFLEAARRLGVLPQDCLVYEDTDAGVEAAQRAGMKWVDVRELLRPKGSQAP